MIVDDLSRMDFPAHGSKADIEACLAGKAYIAVLKHRLTNDTSDRTFRDIFDEAYRAASRGTKDIPTMSNASHSDGTPESLDETIEPFIAGKAYIAVLKHRLAHGSSGKSAKEVYEEAYRAAATMARPGPPDSLGISKAE